MSRWEPRDGTTSDQPWASPVSGQFFPVHQRLLTMAGIYILENMPFEG